MRASLIKSRFFYTLRNSNLFRDSFWALLGGAVGKGLSFLAGVFVARFLGSSIFGEYGTIRTTLVYIAIVSTFGFGYTATKFIAEYAVKNSNKVKHLINTVTIITLIVGSFFALLQTVFAKQIAIFIEAPHLEKIIRTFSVLTLVNAITTTQIAILAGLKKFRDTAVINTIAGVITFFASAILSYYFGLNGALSALLLSCVVQMVVSHILIIKNKRTYTGNDKISSKDLRFILSYSFPVALQDSFYAVAHWLSTYLIIRLADYSEVGMLSAATIWQTIVVSVPIMLKNVMLSYFSSTLEHQSLMRKMLIVSFATSALPALFVILMSWYIASIYGATYVGIQYIIIVVCISAVFICLGEVFVYELLSNNKSWAVFFSRFFRDFLTLLIAYFILSSIQSGQALAYALVALAIHIVYLLFIYYLYRRYTIRNDRK